MKKDNPNKMIAGRSYKEILSRYENKLQNPTQKKIITPDKTLSSLLDIKKNDKEPLTYFNLQSKMNKHFVH